MIVDDSKNNINALSNLFKKFGNKYHLDILKAEDGDEAVELFKSKNQILSLQNIHLIIMDLNMNKMNGD